MNYDRLNIPQDSLSRSPRYTRYLEDGRLLRTQTSAIAAEVAPLISEPTTLVMPGICYRRDVTDKTHVGELHQVDIWIIKNEQVSQSELKHLIASILEGITGKEYRLNPAVHPYTTQGLEAEVRHNGQWLEVGEGGVAHPSLLAPGCTGIALGLGLDRLAMIAKDIDDIRLLRSSNPRISEQMKTLEKYKPVSKYPAVTRDISLALEKSLTIEDISEMIRVVLPRSQQEAIQEIQLISETSYEDLPPKARSRLRLRSPEKNVLIRLHLQSLDKTLTSEECNKIRGTIYRKLNKSRR